MQIDLTLQNLTQIFWTIIIVLNLYVALLLYRMSRVYRAERRIKLLETANIKEHIEFMRTRPDRSVSSGFSPNGSFTTRSRFFEQFLASEPPQLRSCMHVRPNFRSNSSTTAADDEADERYEQRRRQQHQEYQQKQRSQQLQIELQRKHDYNKLQQQQQQYEHQQQQQNLSQQHEGLRKIKSRQQKFGGIMKSQTQPQQLINPKMIEQTSSEETSYNPKPDDEHTLYISDSFGRVVHEIPFRECDYMDALHVVLGDQRWKIKKAWK
ncbi:uncharacterized protein [Eurosta solidaginis]|uniref:uncharacterized protein n=1 Tax=Eurosta solidaginis TaxID=178769 RepID=UPI003530ED69